MNFFITFKVNVVYSQSHFLSHPLPPILDPPSLPPSPPLPSLTQMQLVVYGKDPLPTLTSWVNTSFSSIPNRHVSPQTFVTTPFPQEYSQKLVFYYPVADTNSLSLYWQTAPLDPHYRNDVVEFLSRYLGNEGEGSVLQYLKSESLAVSLSAGLEVSADSFSLFLVSIELTEKGLGRVPDIVKTVFQFIRYWCAKHCF